MNNPMQHHATRHRGFTLIELLVVISIIALLIGILLPALGAARGTARASASMSNIRQWGMGMQMFAVDNNQMLPWDGEDQPGDASGSSAPGQGLVWQVPEWYANAVPTYLSYDAFSQGTSNLATAGSRSIHIDPAATTPPDFPAAYTINNVNGVPKNFLFHYVMNSRLPRDNGLPAGQGAMRVNNIKRIRQEMIINATSTVFMTEKRSVADELAPFGGTADGYYTRTLNRVKGDWQRIAARHNGGGHLAFGDGHAKFTGYIEATTPRDIPRPTTRIDEPRTMNRPDLLWSPLQWQGGLR